MIEFMGVVKLEFDLMRKCQILDPKLFLCCGRGFSRWDMQGDGWISNYEGS